MQLQDVCARPSSAKIEKRESRSLADIYTSLEDWRQQQQQQQQRCLPQPSLQFVPRTPTPATTTMTAETIAPLKDRPVPFEAWTDNDELTPGKGAITSKIKHAVKLKTRPARLAQLLQPSLASCFSLQPMTAYRPVLRHWLQAKTKCQ